MFTPLQMHLDEILNSKVLVIINPPLDHGRQIMKKESAATENRVRSETPSLKAVDRHHTLGTKV